MYYSGLHLKYSPEQCSVVTVAVDDPELDKRLLLLGIQQGLAHATKLPSKRVDLQRVAANFRKVISEHLVEIHRIDRPVRAAGALFLSEIERGGIKGMQIEDVVVRSGLRGRNLGTYLMSYAARLARQRGLQFLAWECEHNNPAQKLYQKVKATRLNDLVPYRLTKDMITQLIMDTHKPVVDGMAKFTVSRRFSLFRTMNFGIHGYDMEPDQFCYGIQVDDLEFDRLECVMSKLGTCFQELNEIRTLNFVDLVVPTSSALHVKLISMLGCSQNTYSNDGDGCLWELNGQAFEDLAVN